MQLVSAGAGSEMRHPLSATMRTPQPRRVHRPRLMQPGSIQAHSGGAYRIPVPVTTPVQRGRVLRMNPPRPQHSTGGSRAQSKPAATASCFSGADAADDVDVHAWDAEQMDEEPPTAEEQRNAVERALTTVLNLTGLLKVAELLHDSVAGLVTAWVLLAVAGVAMAGVGPALPAATATAAVAGVYALLGTPELVHVLYELARGQINIHALTTVAVFGTVVLGCALEGGLLLALFATAGVLEAQLAGSARGDLKALWASVPKTANAVQLLADGSPDLATLTVVSANDMAVGSYCVVRAGEQVPLDGVHTAGDAIVTTQHITGEALPLRRKAGDQVPAGAQVVEGVLVVRTTASMEQSTPARIARLTAAAQRSRPQLRSLLETWGAPYSKVVLAGTVVCTAVLLALGLPLAGAGGAAYRAFGFLAAAAPCALLMTPLAYVAAIGYCAQRGVLVRGGRTLDKLVQAGTVALDKTGTLTTGIMSCVAMDAVQLPGAAAGAAAPSCEYDALTLATALERLAVHPIARAVVAQGVRDNVPRVPVEHFEVTHGEGVAGVVTTPSGSALRVRFGSTSFAGKLANGADAAALQMALADAQRGGEAACSGGCVSAALVAVDAATGAVVHARLFRFADALRERSSAAVESLVHESKLRVLILTGDHAASAQSVGEKVCLEPADVRSGMLPEDKMRVVGELRAEATAAKLRPGVVMVGDGINDAPALAAADVGVAIVDTPSEAAAAAADVLLLHKHSAGLSMLPMVLRVAHRVRSIVQQNLSLAVLSIVGTCTAALTGLVPLWLTVLLHEGTTVLVGLNCMRLLLEEEAQGRVTALAALMACGAAVAFLPLESWAVAAWAAVSRALAGFFAPFDTLWNSCKDMVGGSALAAEHGGRAIHHHGDGHGAYQVLRSAGAGMLAGVLHTLTGPDHLAALAPLTIGRSRAQSTLLGGLWGCGHNTGQILFGMVFLVLRDRLSMNMELISQWGQGVVGVTLVLIGMLGFKEAMELDDAAAESAREEAEAEYGRKFSLGTYFTGLIHGLQPDALLVLLPALALPSGPAAAYLGTFLVGTVLAMASYTCFLGVSSDALAKLRGGANTIKRVSGAAALVAIFIGLSLLLSATLGIDVFNLG